MADNENVNPGSGLLWSERRGGSLPLTEGGFCTLLEHAFTSLKRDGYFGEVLAWGPAGSIDPFGVRSGDAETFFAMKLGDPWPTRTMRSASLLSLHSDDDHFDLIELLHRDAVSEPIGEEPWFDWNQEAGRAEFRERINPILERRDPPLELIESGEIVERAPEPFRRLVEQELPEHAPKKEVTDRVEDAVRHFRRRGATAGDRRAAVKELADVLEFLRADVKEHLLSEDERALFRLANEFAIRHNKRDTRRDFDEPAWLAWAFYVYLATIRLTLELSART